MSLQDAETPYLQSPAPIYWVQADRLTQRFSQECPKPSIGAGVTFCCHDQYSPALLSHYSPDPAIGRQARSPCSIVNSILGHIQASARRVHLLICNHGCAFWPQPVVFLVFLCVRKPKRLLLHAAGIPKFYRWLSERYPLLNQPTDVGETPLVDNLYLDMNGIIHNCTHGNDPGTKLTEEEMIVKVFGYLDKLFQVVKPQRLLFMAIDGDNLINALRIMQSAALLL